jgi:hypothetical protein
MVFCLIDSWVLGTDNRSHRAPAKCCLALLFLGDLYLDDLFAEGKSLS